MFTTVFQGLTGLVRVLVANLLDGFGGIVKNRAAQDGAAGGGALVAAATGPSWQSPETWISILVLIVAIVRGLNELRNGSGNGKVKAPPADTPKEQANAP